MLFSKVFLMTQIITRSCGCWGCTLLAFVGGSALSLVLPATTDPFYLFIRLFIYFERGLGSSKSKSQPFVNKDPYVICNNRSQSGSVCVIINKWTNKISISPLLQVYFTHCCFILVHVAFRRKYVKRINPKTIKTYCMLSTPIWFWRVRTIIYPLRFMGNKRIRVVGNKRIRVV